MERRTLKILEYVNKNSGCQVQSVTKHLGISRPLASAMIRSLEELGLIKKEVGNGRSSSLKITPKGKDVLGD